MGRIWGGTGKVLYVTELNHIRITVLVRTPGKACFIFCLQKDGPIPDVSYQGDRATWGLVCLASSTLNNVFKVIHNAAGFSTSFSWLNVWRDHILFNHSSVGGCLDGFHSSAMMNNGAVKIHVQVFVCKYVFSVLLGMYLCIAFLSHIISLF